LDDDRTWVGAPDHISGYFTSTIMVHPACQFRPSRARGRRSVARFDKAIFD
jgi:hypothetical protein